MSTPDKPLDLAELRAYWNEVPATTYREVILALLDRVEQAEATVARLRRELATHRNQDNALHPDFNPRKTSLNKRTNLCAKSASG